MARQNLENEELGGIIRAKINDNFSELYGNAGLVTSVQPTISSDFSRNDHKLYEQYGLEPKTITQMYDVARASTATYVDATGKIRTAGVNEPRIDYSSGQGRLLNEEARTNLVTWSEDFSNSIWTKTDVTFSGEVCTPSSTTGSKWFAQITGTTAGLAYTKTVVAKAKELDFIQIASSTGFALSAANFDLALGVIGNVSSGVVARIKPLSDGYFECSATFISDNTSASGRLLVALVPTAASGRLANMSTNGTDSLIIKRTQMEQASTPSSYIPTEASAVTRAADNVSRVLGDEFNANEGTWLLDYDGFAFNNTPRLFSVAGGGEIRRNVGGTSLISALEFGATVLTGNQNVRQKLIIRYVAGGTVSFYINGAFVGNGATSYTPSFAGSAALSGGSRNQLAFKYFPKALSDSECQELTKL